MAKCLRIASILLPIATAIGTSSAYAGWATDGIAICSVAEPQYSVSIASDGSGGAILVWIDERRGTSQDIYAQRIDANGSVLWTAGGVPICTADAYHDYYMIVSDGSGGAIIAWRDDRGGPAFDFRIYAQRINAAGVAEWPTNGIAICTVDAYQDGPYLASDGLGGALASWEDNRSGNSTDIYAQMISPDGSLMWAATGAVVCKDSSEQYYPQLASDGSGGAIVTWRDGRNESMYDYWDIYAQHIDANGAAMWTADGVPICTAIGAQGAPQIVSDGSGGAVIAWQTVRSDTSLWVNSAQKVDASGSVRWMTDGVVIRTNGGYSPIIAPDGSGGAILAWRDGRNLATYDDVYAQRVSADGSVLWTAEGVPICNAIGDQYCPRIIADGSGGAIISLWDKRSGGWDMYAQRIDEDGKVLWTVDGVPICTALGNQLGGDMTSDGSGGAIVAWEDPRGTDSDIYAQRVDAAGHTVVATLLQDYGAAFSEAGVALTWTLSEVDEGVEFFIERATASD